MILKKKSCLFFLKIWNHYIHISGSRKTDTKTQKPQNRNHQTETIRQTPQNRTQQTVPTYQNPPDRTHLPEPTKMRASRTKRTPDSEVPPREKIKGHESGRCRFSSRGFIYSAYPPRRLYQLQTSGQYGKWVSVFVVLTSWPESMAHRGAYDGSDDRSVDSPHFIMWPTWPRDVRAYSKTNTLVSSIRHQTGASLSSGMKASCLQVGNKDVDRHAMDDGWDKENVPRQTMDDIWGMENFRWCMTDEARKIYHVRW